MSHLLCDCKHGILMSYHYVLHPKHWRHGFDCSIKIAFTFKLASNRCGDCGYSMCVIAIASNGIKGSSGITNKCKVCLLNHSINQSKSQWQNVTMVFLVNKHSCMKPQSKWYYSK